MLYGYKFDGNFSPNEGQYYDSSRILLDPYAKAVVSRGEYGALGPEGNCWPQMAGMVPSQDDQIDWEGDAPLHNPQKDLIIYEMHVCGFTRHESSHATHPGVIKGTVLTAWHLCRCNPLGWKSFTSFYFEFRRDLVGFLSVLAISCLRNFLIDLVVSIEVLGLFNKRSMPNFYNS